MRVRQQAAVTGPGPTRALLRAARADPRHLPETLAVQAVRLLGGRAGAAADHARSRHPELTPAELRAAAATAGVRESMAEGAFLGGPFMLLWPAAFGAALAAQVRMVLELAALSAPDRDPAALAADLLVLQGVSPSPEDAAALLEAAAGTAPAGEVRESWWATGRRLALLIGLLTPAEAAVGRVRRVASWVGVLLLVLVGLVAPLVWIPASAEMYRRATGRLAARATAYYAPADGGRGEPAAPRRWRVSPAAVVVGLRTAVSVLLIAGVLAGVLFADLTIAHSHEFAAFLLLVGVSGLYWALLARRRGGGRSVRR